jgi:type II secretory pathway component GspD/PulD (secretin)
MKPSKAFLLTLGLSTGLRFLCSAQTGGGPNNPPPVVPAPANPPAVEQAAPPSTLPAVAQQVATNDALIPGLMGATNVVAVLTNAPEPAVLVETGTNGLRMNIRNAPLNLVLEHLVKAAGFIVNGTTQVRGSISVLSDGPVSKDEAVALLNSELKKNGYSIVRNGRILTIVEQGSVKTANLEITTPYNPDDMESSDEVITALIHIRYANAPQLMANLEILLPTTATLSANESANTLILVATKTDIKRMLKIINALDSSIASVSSIKVVPLKYADAKDTATLITQLFSSQGGNQGGQQGGSSGRGSFFSMLSGGGSPFSRGGFGGRGGGGGPAGTPGTAAAAKVVAVADDRSNSVVVSAPDDLLTTISEMVARIDQEVTDEVDYHRFRLVFADPSEVADQLALLFPDPTAPNNGAQSSAMPFFFGRRSGGGATSTATPSDHMKKLARVVAVPDPRTQSLLVTASKSLMPTIIEMVSSLDADPGKREVVKVFELQNADVQDVNTVLQDLFNRNNVRMNNNNNSRSMLGNNNPLTQRQTQQQSTTQNTFGTSANRGGGGGGGN